jgi:putative transposase
VLSSGSCRFIARARSPLVLISQLARVASSGLAPHITQSHKDRRQVWFADADYARSLRLLTEFGAVTRMKFPGCCVMPNHVHLLLVPATDDELRRCVRGASRLCGCDQDAVRTEWKRLARAAAMDEARISEALRHILFSPSCG